MTTRQRERDIVDATRALFDERGMQDAPIEEIAQAVGIKRTVVYRHFATKEELFILAVTRYLDELADRLREAVDPDDAPHDQLRRITEAYADFCLEYPAFPDCALSLMRRPAAELQERVSDATWIRVGQAMGASLSICAKVLADGRDAGVFKVEDPDFMANHLYTSALGTMHLARLGIGVREASGGVPVAFPIDPEQVRRAMVRVALAAVA